MRYFYAKLGEGNSLAGEYLGQDTPIGCPAVPIFFDLAASTREEFILGGSAKEQGENFFWCEDRPDDARIVALHNGLLFLLQPAGEVVFWRCEDNIGYAQPGQFVKLLPVKVLMRTAVAEVPAVLSTMTANRYYYTGTFREISDEGIIRALQSLAAAPVSPVECPRDLILCLSSIELETLIARLFEEAGCFVPAHRGGSLKGIDILARNTSGSQVSVLSIDLPPGGATSIQVKRSTTISEPPPGCDHLIIGERDANAILESVQATKRTREWLAESLCWLPSEALSTVGVVR